MRRLACAGAAILAAPAAQPFDHSLFDGLLRRYVERRFVDYDGFERAPEFPRYLQQLDRADPERLEAY